MKQLLILLFLALSWSAGVSAEQLRVLMSFGADGHRVEKVFKVPSGLVTTQDEVARQGQGLQFRSADRAANSGVLLQWLDSAGGVLAENIIADPRVTHAPTQVVGSVTGQATIQQEPIPDKSLKPTGVYLINGPADSKQLRLDFPPVILSTQQIPASSLVLPLPH